MVGGARCAADCQLCDLAVVAVDHFEAGAVELDGFAAVGDAAEGFDEVAVEGGFVRRVERETEFAGDEPDGGGAVNAQVAVVALDQLLGGGVEFVVDLSDELFEHVFEREQSGHGAVFVDDEREVAAGGARRAGPRRRGFPLRSVAAGGRERAGRSIFPARPGAGPWR